MKIRILLPRHSGIQLSGTLVRSGIQTRKKKLSREETKQKLRPEQILYSPLGRKKKQTTSNCDQSPSRLWKKVSLTHMRTPILPPSKQLILTGCLVRKKIPPDFSGWAKGKTFKSGKMLLFFFEILNTYLDFGVKWLLRQQQQQQQRISEDDVFVLRVF